MKIDDRENGGISDTRMRIFSFFVSFKADMIIFSIIE